MRLPPKVVSNQIAIFIVIVTEIEPFGEAEEDRLMLTIRGVDGELEALGLDCDDRFDRILEGV